MLRKIPFQREGVRFALLFGPQPDQRISDIVRFFIFLDKGHVIIIGGEDGTIYIKMKPGRGRCFWRKNKEQTTKRKARVQ